MVVNGLKISIKGGQKATDAASVPSNDTEKVVRFALDANNFGEN